nr:MAG TPA: hypothetical protein [Caudoviricetes sp.]
MEKRTLLALEVEYMRCVLKTGKLMERDYLDMMTTERTVGLIR